MKNIIALFFQFLLLVTAIFSLKLIPNIPERYLPILELLPFILMFTSLILGIKFNRSQLIYSTLLFSLVYAYLFWSPVSGQAQNELVLNSITILLSLNVALISFYSERGIVTVIGLSRFFIIAAQVLALAWFIETGHPDWSRFVNKTLFPDLEIKFLFFSQSAILALLSSFFVMAVSFFYHSNGFRSAILAAMILVIYAITFDGKDLVTLSVLFSFALIFPLFTLVSESYRMAYLDELTNLPGRRALNETLNKLGSKYVIAMLDVDHFKKFNDTYGHDAGDDVLRLLGNKLKSVSGGGKAFRYGGEEFTVVFSGSKIAEASKHLERLRENVADNKFTLRKQDRRHSNKGKLKRSREVKVTISIGYAERNEQAKTPAQVLKLADKALYRAKRKGRNCISQ